jgi:hypothetical protein
VGEEARGFIIGRIIVGLIFGIVAGVIMVDATTILMTWGWLLGRWVMAYWGILAVAWALYVVGLVSIFFGIEGKS